MTSGRRQRSVSKKTAMAATLQKLARLIGSRWMCLGTLLLFAAEASWLAVTSRFPMAFDETYHFNRIQFFSHHLSPVVTSQPSSTYRLGAIVQDPSFLYHYLLSFPYRCIALFTHNLEIQVAGLRCINVVFALMTLWFMRRLLRLMQVPPVLANMLLLVFALTPIVVVLAAQINYDNLLILLATLCMYTAVAFSRSLGRGVFDTKMLLTLGCLCLSASLVKFTFLPILLTIIVMLAWRIMAYQRQTGVSLLATAKAGLGQINTLVKILLMTGVVLGSLVCLRFYGVNLIKYHNPAPQCSQVLNISDCKQYYAWASNYNIQRYYQTHPSPPRTTVLHYSASWLLLNTSGIFGEILPLRGVYYISTAFCTIVALLVAAALACTIVNFKRLRGNADLRFLTAISVVYGLFVWGRNYHDYLRLGLPVAINGRYMLPVLFYFYILLGMGVYYALEGSRQPRLVAKAVLVLMTVASFVYYGGYAQYISVVSPQYGQLSSSNTFILTNYEQSTRANSVFRSQ